MQIAERETLATPDLARGFGRGPESDKRGWKRVDASRVGRPTFRTNRNPVPSNVGGTSFPYNGVSADGTQELELVEWALYDFNQIAAGQTMQVLNYFKNGYGQPMVYIGGASTPNKTFLMTNIQSQNGVLPNPQSFLVRSLRNRIVMPALQADLELLAYATLATFQAGDGPRTYFQAPFIDIPSAGAQLVGFGGAAGAANQAGFGWPSFHNQYSLSTGLYDPNISGQDQGYVINQGRTFVFTLDPTQSPTIGAASPWALAASGGGGLGLGIWIALQGVLARSKTG